jgi:hypothetical protein
MAPAEDKFLKPLLNTEDSIDISSLKMLPFQANGKNANIGLIATTPKFYSQYTRMVAVVGYTKIHIGQGNICSWKKCELLFTMPLHTVD